MDKTVTFRFYRVARHRRSGTSFADSLRQIAEIRAPSRREAKLAPNFDVRLETLTPRPGGVLEGEITRIQKTNFPSEIEGDRRFALRTGNPLGHGVVFRYNSHRSVLGVQYDTRVASPGRLIDYVQNLVEDTSFRIEPIVRDDHWDRFNQGPTRKLVIGIASPANIERVGRGGAAPLIASMQDMGEAYEAPTITIEMSMGTRGGGLSEAVKSVASHIRRELVGGRLDVTKFRAVTEVEEGPNDHIDLLEDILSSTEELPLHDKDPELNYRIRMDALRATMNEWIR